MTDKILLENGDSLLLENGDRALQEWGIRWTASVGGSNLDNTLLTPGQVRQEGDFVIALAVGVNTSGPTPPTVTPAAGWTTHSADLASIFGAYGLTIKLLSRVLSASDASASSQSVATVSGGTLGFDAWGISGADASSFVINRTFNATSGGIISWPAITATRASPLSIRIGLPHYNGPDTFGNVGPAGHTRAPMPATAATDPFGVAWVASPTATSIGTTTAKSNYDASQYPWAAYSIALNEASAQAAPTVTGSLNSTLAPTTSTASATVVALPTITATVSKPLGSASSTASANVGIGAQVNRTLGSISSTSSASIAPPPLTASVNATLGSMTGSAAATVSSPSVGNQPWTPADLTVDVRVRLDPSSLTGTEGGAATWTNTSGDTHPANFTGSAQYRGNVQNGLPVVRFGDGGTTGLVGTSGVMPVGQTSIAMMLRRRGDISNNVEVISQNRGDPYCSIYIIQGGYRLYDVAGRTPVVAIDDTFHIVIFTWAPDGTVSLRKNGQLVWSETGAPGYLGSGYQDIGYSSGTSGSPTDIGEYIITDNLGLEDAEKLEGYLAHKWALEGLLPANHAYKSAAPTTGSAGPAEATANLTQTLGQMSVQATGAVIPVRSASLAQTLAPASSSSSATVSITAQANKSLAPATSTAAVSVVAQGSLVRALGGLSSASAAQAQVAAQSASSLAPAASSANGQVTVSATASPALGATTSVATGAISYPGINATSSLTLGAATTTTSAGVQITASANRSLSPATSVGLGSIQVTGSASAQLAPTTVSATAGPIVSAQASNTLSPIAAASTAGVEVRAQAGVTLGQATLASNALGAPKAGLVSTLGQMTAVASATVQITGSAAASLAPTSVAATGSSTVSASLAKSLAPATSTASATAPATATLNRLLGGLQSVSTAEVGVRASVSATLAPATLNASSGSSSGANLNATLAPTSVQSTGVVRIGGATISGLSPMTGSATAVVPVAANSNITTGDLTAASNVIAPIFGRANATLEPMTAQAQVFTLVDGQTGAVLGAVSLNARATARLFGDLEVDPTRMVMITADNRMVLVAPDDRMATIPHDPRTAA